MGQFRKIMNLLKLTVAFYMVKRHFEHDFQHNKLPRLLIYGGVLISFILAIGFGCGHDDSNNGGSCTTGSQVMGGPTAPDGVKDFDSIFEALAVHPIDANTIWIGTELNGVVKGVYSGGTYTWTRQRVGMLHMKGSSYAQEFYPEVHALAVSDADPNVVVAATTAGPMSPTSSCAIGGIYVSTDGGATWSRRNSGMTNNAITGITILPDSSSKFIASAQGETSTQGTGQYFSGGLYRTSNAGTGWTPIANTAGNDAAGKDLTVGLTVRGGAAPFTVFGYNRDAINDSFSLGLLMSLDSGVSFTAVADNAEVKSKKVNSISVSADGMHIFAVTDTGTTYLSTDGGTNFGTLAGAWGNISVAVSPADANIVLSGGAGPAAVIYRSSNALAGSGATSAAVFTTASTAPLGHLDVIAFAPSSPSVVYAVTKGYLVYRSADAGQTWSLPTNGNLRAWINANP